MQTHDLQQGTPEWAAHRARHFNASDAPAMLGCSPYTTRAQLLHQLHTGIAPEVDAQTQARFDKGHSIEAIKRPVAEAIIGEDLYPVVGTEGELSASFDGLTMMEDTNWECKSLNDELRDALQHKGVEGAPLNNALDLPKVYRVQMEQQCAVSGCTRVLFTASNGQDDDRHCWYTPDPALRAEIVAGWKQFAADLAVYTAPEVLDAPIIVGHRPDQLPALRSTVTGELVLESNIKEWEAAALTYIKGVRDHELKTDEDFANADAAAKWCDTSKATLQGVKASLMSATGDVNTAVDTLDRIVDELDKTRIAFSNAIKARKESRKGEIVAGGIAALRDHVTKLNERLGKAYMPAITADFAGAIRGKSSLAKMEDAVATELARAKIAANEVADRIQVNLDWLREHAKDHTALFPDTGAIVLKAHDDLVALAQNRINEHKQAEAKKEAARREEIRLEEAAKLQQAEAEKNRMRMSEISGIQQQVIIASLGRAGVRKGGTIECIRETLAETEAWVIDEANFGPLTGTALGAKATAVADIKALLRDAETSAAQPAAAPAPVPIAAPVAAPQAPAANSSTVVPLRATADTRPHIRLGQIGDKLGFTLTADFLKQLGFEPVATEKSAKLYRASDEDLIYEALIAHIRTVQAKQLQAA